MMKTAIQSLKLLLVMTLFLGGFYPLMIYGMGTLAFPFQSKGLILEQDGKIIGSQNIGQNFSTEGYFIGRPSGAGDNGYDATASSGTNLAPTNKLLLDKIDAIKETLKARFGDGDIPSDLVMSSGSGLDPHISKSAALYQVRTIAKERKVNEAEVLDIVNVKIEAKLLGILGEERVNVLLLNSALNQKFGVIP